MKLSRWPFTQFSCTYDTYCVILRNKRVFISLSHQACCEKLEFLEAGYRKLHEYAIITSHAPGSKWEPKVQCNPGGAFCDVSIRVLLSSSAESEYENGWKKQYSPAGRLADICKAIPQHNYLWTSGPCKHRAVFFFFLMSSSVVFLLPYGMPSSILYPFAAHVGIHSFYCPSATSHARACALSLEFYDFINSASAYLQHCSHCFPPTVCGHLCVLKLPPFFPSVLPLLNSFTVVILTPVKTSPPPQAYLPFK